MKYEYFRSLFDAPAYARELGYLVTTQNNRWPGLWLAIGQDVYWIYTTATEWLWYTINTLPQRVGTDKQAQMTTIDKDKGL